MQRSNGSLPVRQGWYYLSRDNAWLYDSKILVSRLVTRNSSNSPCPLQRDVDIPGYNLETLWTTGITSCLQFCWSRPACLGLTYMENICRLKYSMEKRVEVKSNIRIESVTFNCSLGLRTHFEAVLPSMLIPIKLISPLNILSSGNFWLLLAVASLPGTLLLLLITISAVLTRTSQKQIIYV